MEPNVADVVRPKKNINILKWVLIVAIVIVLNLLFNFSIQLFYKMPEWDNFCKQDQVSEAPKTEAECVAKGGAWETASEVKRTSMDGPVEVAVPVSELKQTSSCNIFFTCQKEFDEARKTYSRNVFVVLVILGVLALLLGFFLSNYTVVALGLSLGGVLSLVIASMRHWEFMGDYLRVIVLALALVVLIWLGIKKIKD